MPAQVIVESTTNLQQRIQAGQHTWIIDEPESIGGNDAGPDPYDTLMAALGSCTAITLILYARRKHWPLKQVRVELSHTKIHAEDCETCATQSGKVDQIEKTIFLSGDLTPDQIERLAEIAGKCPVNQTLLGEIQMVEQIYVTPRAPSTHLS